MTGHLKELKEKGIERIVLGSEIAINKYDSPIVCTYSGGKDSDVLLDLFIDAYVNYGIKFEVHHSHTTIDAPPTIYHIRKKFKELRKLGIKCNIEMPTYRGGHISMWELIPIKKLPPTRMVRYCCSVLKETGCHNRMIATGVRKNESHQRESRETYEIISRIKKR